MTAITQIFVEDGIVAWEMADSQVVACIVMPTYNERMNIERVLDEIYVQDCPGTELHVLVVDDNSPDGTAEIVREYMRRNGNVHLLLRRRKDGLGKAYAAGMTYALDVLAPDVILEMDADRSHSPADIPRLIAEVQGGADCVIGSRYVEGGNLPADWGVHRRFTSTCANFAARTLLGISDVKDCSGGFRAIRCEMLRKIPLDALDVRGYAFQAVLLEEILHRGGTIREIPITFHDREFGASKMALSDVIEGFTAFTRVRANRIAERLAEGVA